MSDGYIHGYSEAEGTRLIEQAEFLAPWVFDGVDLSQRRRLLEVGVGVGAETRLIRARWPQLHVVGIDVSAEQLERARRLLADDIRAGAVELLHHSATDLPVAEGSCDAGFICWLLEHVADPLRVLEECARVLQPGSPVFVTEVYNASLTIEPRQPLIEDYWRALNRQQRRAGGHPNIGARLGELAFRAGLEVLSFRFLPVLGDARDPVKRLERLRYFQTLLRSAEPELRAAHAFDEAQLPSVWAAFDAVEADPDALICYTMAKLEARVR
jgi:ubiquinone/menaquinone biosynthesis C-methylase UbiE